MNINAFSAGIQPHSIKAYNTTSFKGVQKAATQFINAGTAQKAANKTGKIGNFFSKVSHAIGDAASKALNTIKNGAIIACNTASKGIHKVFDTVKSAGSKVSKGVSDFFKGLKNKRHIKITKENNKSITSIQVGNNIASSKNIISISAKDGKTVTVSTKNGKIAVNGKIYEYDGKLPDGIKISSNGLSIKGKNGIKDLSQKIEEFAKTVEENGKLIGTEG